MSRHIEKENMDFNNWTTEEACEITRKAIQDEDEEFYKVLGLEIENEETCKITHQVIEDEEFNNILERAIENEEACEITRQVIQNEDEEFDRALGLAIEHEEPDEEFYKALGLAIEHEEYHISEYDEANRMIE